MRTDPRLFVAAVVALVLSGCAASQKAGIYQTGQVQQKLKVVLAVVVDVRDVDIEATPSGAGATSGAAAGAMAGAGAGLGGQGRSSVMGAVAGAVVGGVVGTVAEKAFNSRKGIEIVYRAEGSQDVLALVQEKDEQNVIGVGDRIRILEGQFSARAVKIAAGR